MKHRLSWLCTLMILSVVLTACEDSAPTAAAPADTTASAPAPTAAAAAAADGAEEAVESVTLKRDENGEPGEEVTSFKPTDHVMHFVIQFGSIQLNTKMSAELIAVDAGGSKNASVIKKDMDALAANTFTFTASLDKDWPTGQYKLDVYLADKLVKSQPFSVE
jgi:hypothetical protein